MVYYVPHVPTRCYPPKGMRRTRARRLDWFFALDKQNRFYYLSHHHISAKFARFVFESDNDQLVREAALEQVASDLSAPWRVAYLSKILHENSNNDIGKCAAHALEHIKLE